MNYPSLEFITSREVNLFITFLVGNHRPWARLHKQFPPKELVQVIELLKLVGYGI